MEDNVSPRTRPKHTIRHLAPLGNIMKQEKKVLDLWPRVIFRSAVWHPPPDIVGNCKKTADHANCGKLLKQTNERTAGCTLSWPRPLYISLYTSGLQHPTIYNRPTKRGEMRRARLAIANETATYNQKCETSNLVPHSSMRDLTSEVQACSLAVTNSSQINIGRVCSATSQALLSPCKFTLSGWQWSEKYSHPILHHPPYVWPLQSCGLLLVAGRCAKEKRLPVS